MTNPVISIINGQPRRMDMRFRTPVTLDILPGEHVAIVGDNGSGKSLLVGMITGKYPLALGTIEYDFSPLATRKASEGIRLVTFRDAYGEQGPNYYQQRYNAWDAPALPTVGEVLSDASEELCQSLNIGELWHKQLHLLSSGELRRFSLARALKSKPRVLIVEEPYIGLDNEAREMLTQLLASLAARETTIILVVARERDIPPFISRTIRIDDRTLLANEAKQKKEIIACEDVSLDYANRTVLSHLTWHVYEGERWLLGGSNGAGKSTLLSLVCADNPRAYAMPIRLFGRKRGTGESIWDIKRKIGYASPELFSAYRHPLAALNIVATGLMDTIGLFRRPTEEQQQQARLWMQKFGAEHLAERNYLELSSGEQRLLLLIRAFVKEPQLLILDEPFHGLDDRMRLLATQNIIDYCQNPDRTLILVSHYAEEVPPVITNTLTLTKHT